MSQVCRMSLHWYKQAPILWKRLLRKHETFASPYGWLLMSPANQMPVFPVSVTYRKYSRLIWLLVYESCLLSKPRDIRIALRAIAHAPSLPYVTAFIQARLYKCSAACQAFITKAASGEKLRRNVPDAIRTHGLSLRRRTLYPAELREPIYFLPALSFNNFN